jgi:hypothetical protein
MNYINDLELLLKELDEVQMKSLEAAKVNVKAATNNLHAIVANGGSFQEKRKARNALESRQLELHDITGNVNDLPASCDSGF